MARKRTTTESLGWLALAGAAGTALYLLFWPKAPAPQAMVPTVDPRFAGRPRSAGALKLRQFQ